MKKLLLILPLLFLTSITSFSQSQNIKVNNPPVPYYSNPNPATDYVVSGTEPLARPSGVFKTSNSTIYVSVPDTNIQAGADIVILSSADNGATWLNISQYSTALEISKSKMIRSSLDSIYCFFLSGSSIFRWNVINNSINQVFSGGYRDFDVAASSTGALYLFTDSLAFTSIDRYGSVNGGVTWGSRGLITNAGAIPKIYMSGLGDTLVLNFYGPVLADTATSVIRSVRYRETTPGTMAVAGSFSNVVLSNDTKSQFASVFFGSKLWFFYTSGSAGNIDLKCKVSTNSGALFTDSFTVGSKPGRDEFWFDAKHYTAGNGGVGLIYYSDSAQTGPPTNNSDKMNYTSASNTNPSSFSAPLQFSENPPVFSAVNGYIPTLIQYNNAGGNAGAIWVGETAGSRKLYFDVLNFPAPLPALNLTALIEGFYNAGSNTMIRDTVKVFLRNSFSPYSVADSATVYLSTSGTGTYSFSKADYGVDYYIAIEQRNSIQTWSSSVISFNSLAATDYDITNLQTKAYGNNTIQVNTSPVKYADYSGDVNQDLIIDAGDLSQVENDVANALTGYVTSDVNGDDIADASDLSLVENNVSLGITVVSP